MSLTVKDLKEILDLYPEEYLVVMSKDGGGNSYSPLADFGIGRYKPNSTWDGYFTSLDGNGKFLRESRRNSICLWPTN